MTDGEWEQVGTVYVDSGSMMVGDPCYTQGADATDASVDWEDFLARTWPGDFGKDLTGPKCGDGPVNARGKAGLGIVTDTGWGDGEYPVYVIRKDGRTAALKVVFMEDEDDGEW